MRNIFQVFLLGVFCALTVFVRSGFGVSCETIQKKHWEKYVIDFGLKKKLKELDCSKENGGPWFKFAEAVYAIQQTVLKADSPKFLPKQGFYPYIAERIEKTRKKGCKYTASMWFGEMTLCKSFFRNTIPYRASTLVHESRHMDADEPGHVNCVRVIDKGGCDASYDREGSGGGYNYDIYYLESVLKFAKAHDLAKDVVKSEINALVPRRFNEISKAELKRLRKL